MSPRAAVAAAIVALALLAAPVALAAFARDGRYSGRTTQTYGGKRGVVKFSVGHSGNRMARISVQLLYRCPKLGRFPTTLRVRGTFVGKGRGTFAQTGSFRTAGPFGRAARVEVKLYGRFVTPAYAYGEVQAVMAVLRGDNVVDRCASALSFRAKRR